MVDRKTAAELMAELEADPQYVAQVAELARVREAQWASWNDAARPLFHDLREVGLDIQRLQDLSSVSTASVPVLLSHLKRPTYADPVKDVILRSLASPVAAPFWSELVRLLKDEHCLSPAVRYLAAVALVGAASEVHLDEILDLLRDTNLGEHRLPLLMYLADSKRPAAKMALKELQADPVLGWQIKVLRRLARSRRGT